jgi:hypothetical protein
MDAVDVYLGAGKGNASLAALVALLAGDEDSARELVTRLDERDVHLLEPAAERLAELAYERRAR